MKQDEANLIGAGRWKLAADNVLLTSDGRHWSGLAAEMRRHIPGEVPEMISDRTVVALAFRGNSRAVIHRRGNGLRQARRATTGTFWLCPAGVAEDEIRITGHVAEMLHIYLPRQPFNALSVEDGYPDLDAVSVAYDTGPHDVWIAAVGQAVVAELLTETASGRLLVETAGLTLAAALAHRHAGRSLASPLARPHALDPRRLQRVLAYIDSHLENDISVADLAQVACVSQYHFIRAFKAAAGLPPHRFIGERRLQRAKLLIKQGNLTLSEVAFACRFSSQANFSRAFRRTVGMNPGDYRRTLR